MRSYDDLLFQHGRLNHYGPSSALSVLKNSQFNHFELCDYLWNKGEFPTLFLELWRLHEAQVNRLCKAFLRKEWSIPADEINRFFNAEELSIDGSDLFEALFFLRWHQVSGFVQGKHKMWVTIRNQMIKSRSSIAPSRLEEGCIYLCKVIDGMAEWGLQQSFSYDGLADLDSIGLPTQKTAPLKLTENLEVMTDTVGLWPDAKWQTFKKLVGFL
jgi:hypothetical protein